MTWMAQWAQLWISVECKKAGMARAREFLNRNGISVGKMTRRDARKLIRELAGGGDDHIVVLRMAKYFTV